MVKKLDTSKDSSLKHSKIHQRLSQLIKVLAQKFGSVRELARQVNVTNNTLTNWMNFDNTPSLEKLERLAKGIGWTTEELISFLVSEENPIEAIERNKKSSPSTLTPPISMEQILAELQWRPVEQLVEINLAIAKRLQREFSGSTDTTGLEEVLNQSPKFEELKGVKFISLSLKARRRLKNWVTICQSYVGLSPEEFIQVAVEKHKIDPGTFGLFYKSIMELSSTPFPQSYYEWLFPLISPVSGWIGSAQETPILDFSRTYTETYTEPWSNFIENLEDISNGVSTKSSSVLC
ncbi:hypothetical protein LYNGBM3L_62160 [Moorena producens 3L]|uniref:HTH cro/C1-type domain-containing protein n=1 Tax=Moorena producens 3L TaxID=489825 RepID=F4Y0P1_9CYAN|nr:hypothetical protein LYNGBM3L_62160 [Moorena producens 3L]OLT64616.1 hypothetical protein BI334_05870 [Moorena producens 3L]